MFHSKTRLIRTCVSIFALTAIMQPLNAQSDKQNGELTESQRASVMFDFNLQKIRENKMMKGFDLNEIMQQNGIPQNEDFDITKIDRIFGGIQIPDDPAAFQPHTGEELKTNFFVRFEFSDSSSATEMIESFKNKGVETHDVDGKTYYSPDDGKAPPNLRLHQTNEKTVEMGTKQYVFHKDRNLSSKNLTQYWKQLPKNSAIRISIDLESNRGVVDQLVEQAKANAPSDAAGYFSLIDDLAGLTLGIDFDSDKLFMLRASGKDSSTTENLRTGIDGLLGIGKFFGGNGLKQSGMDEESQKVFSEVLKALKATADDNTVSVDIVKPEGFDEVIANLIEQ